MAIRQSQLKERAYYFRADDYSFSETRKAIAQRKAFLCHSHKDEELVKGLLQMFKDAGIDLYVDWKDHTMPEKPNAETARKIQNKIKEYNLFLFLATANSKASRWCPWEIGYADSSKRNIYIIPTTDNSDTYGNEYLDLYSQVDFATSDNGVTKGLALYEAGGRNGKWLNTSNLI